MKSLGPALPYKQMTKKLKLEKAMKIVDYLRVFLKRDAKDFCDEEDGATGVGDGAAGPLGGPYPSTPMMGSKKPTCDHVGHTEDAASSLLHDKPKKLVEVGLGAGQIWNFSAQKRKFFEIFHPN